MQEVLGVQGTQPLEGYIQYVVEGYPVRLIGLDTHIPNENAGQLDERQLQWLDEKLAQAPEQPTLIFMHHPPILSGLTVMDNIGLHGRERFEAVVAKHPQIERIVAGHLHMALTTRFGGTILAACSSTKSAWLPDMSHPHQLILQPQAPSCMLHFWRPNMGLLTHTSGMDTNPDLIMLHNGKNGCLTNPIKTEVILSI